MTPQRPTDEGHPARPGGTRSSPQTDPTNPYHQEASGEWAGAEQASERRQDEPGRTDEDRDERAP